MKTNQSLLNSFRQAERYASFSRRQFLRGLGACLALPAFESLVPSTVCAGARKAALKAAPVRMAFVYVPNGIEMHNWTPPEGRLTFPELSCGRATRLWNTEVTRSAGPARSGRSPRE